MRSYHRQLSLPICHWINEAVTPSTRNVHLRPPVEACRPLLGEIVQSYRAAGESRGPIDHYSDQGCQYTSIAFGLRCKEAGVRPSMGSVADCYDNAMCESLFATLECELLDQKSLRTQAEARMAVF